MLILQFPTSRIRQEVKRMAQHNTASHVKHHLEAHIVWCTKYRYRVLTGKVAERCRELIRQTCTTNGIEIVKGNMRADHVHILITYPPKLSVSEIVQKLKGRSSRILQEEFPELKKRYWGRHFWAAGYFVDSISNISEKVISQYIEEQVDEENEVFKIT